MQAPYVAVAWRAGSDGSSDAAKAVAAALAGAGWSMALSQEGLALWRRADRPIPVARHGDAVLLGRHFPGPEAGRPGGRVDPAAGVADRARALSREGWGSYLALLRDPADGTWWVFRDPSGAHEAFTWTLGDLQVACSGLDHLPSSLLPPRLALDWTVIADCLNRPAPCPAASGAGSCRAGSDRR
jgi:hypothetical protein